MTAMQTPPVRRIFDAALVPSDAYLLQQSSLADDVIRAFAEPPLTTGTAALDTALPNRGATFGSVLELFGPSGVGKSFVTGRFVRTVVASALLVTNTAAAAAAQGSGDGAAAAAVVAVAPPVNVYWLITSPSQRSHVAATVRDILDDVAQNTRSISADAAGELVGHALSVALVQSPGEVMSALEATAARVASSPVPAAAPSLAGASCTPRTGGAPKHIVVLDSIYSILLGEEMQFGSAGSSTGGGAAYAHVLGTIRRLVRNLAALHCFVWVVNGATSSSGVPGGGGGSGGRFMASTGRALRPYGGQLWFTASDVSVEMTVLTGGTSADEDDVDVEHISSLSSLSASPIFKLFRPQGLAVFPSE